MKKLSCQRSLALSFILAGALGVAQAGTITVTTTDNGSVNGLSNALATAVNGTTINFNIPGAGPHYIVTPIGGYPIVTNITGITINGYSQPGSSVNSNPILGSNNAVIKVFLASTNGECTDLTGISGYGGEGAVLSFLGCTNVVVSGLGFLGFNSSPASGIGNNGDNIYAIAAAGGGQPTDTTHIWGCRFGLDYDNVTVYEFQKDVVSYGARNSGLLTIGVAPGSANPRSQFNIFIGGYITFDIGTSSAGGRINVSGNFLNVYPDGLHDFNIDGSSQNGVDHKCEAIFEFSSPGTNSVFGTDGDGINDDQERNIVGGMIVSDDGDNNIFETYGSAGAGLRISGNYFGIGVDGLTRFTNGGPTMSFLNIYKRSTASMVIGSDFDGVSDALEANLFYWNNPFSALYGTPPVPGAGGTWGWMIVPNNNPAWTGRISLRGNVMVNNDLAPFNYADNLNDLLAPFVNYMSPFINAAGASSAADLIPQLSPTNIFPNLKGTFPPGIAPWTNITVDVYTLDPEGWTNGQSFGLAELIEPSGPTNGFAQGGKYLGSFAVPNTGSFNLNLPANAGAVTVTVNYSQDPPGTHNGRTHTSNFSNPAYLVPGGPASVGLTQVVPDVPVWYDQTANGGAGGVKLGPIVPLLNQMPDNGTWEPWVSVVGEKNFVIISGKFADDGGFTHQRYSVAIQPAAPGTWANGRLGEGFYDDSFKRYTNNISSRNNGNPPRIYGDRRYGAVNFATGGEADPQDQGSFFNFGGRFDPVAIPLYANAASIAQRCDLVQTFSLDPNTLVQTPLVKAFDCNSLGHPEFLSRTDASNQQRGRFGGGLAALDNGNFVSLMDDRSPFFPGGNSGNEAIAAIFTPAGGVVQASWLVSPNEAWSDPSGFAGGFCIRVGVGNTIAGFPNDAELFFYNNAGTLIATNFQNAPSGLNLDSGRGDGTKICSDIRSPYVFLATGGWLLAYNGSTGAYLAKCQFNDDLDPANIVDRTDVACDSLGNVCVAWDGKPVGGAVFANYQIIARVFHFDGRTFTPITHSFFPYISHDSDVNNVLGFHQENSNVEMTTRYICIASKGQINSTNNAASGPDSAAQTTVYTIINNPGYVPPTLTVTASGGNLIISWPASGGDGTLQSTTVVKPASWSNVSPQPASVLVNGNTYQKTVPIGAGKLFFRLVPQ